MTGTMSKRIALLAPAALLAGVLSASAQNVGTIAGAVTDPQGLPIPGASVTLLNRISQTSQETVSGADGGFTLANIPFGIYVLAASLEGFAPAQQVVDV